MFPSALGSDAGRRQRIAGITLQVALVEIKLQLRHLHGEKYLILMAADPAQCFPEGKEIIILRPISIILSGKHLCHRYPQAHVREPVHRQASRQFYCIICSCFQFHRVPAFLIQFGKFHRDSPVHALVPVKIKLGKGILQSAAVLQFHFQPVKEVVYQHGLGRPRGIDLHGQFLGRGAFIFLMVVGQHAFRLRSLHVFRLEPVINPPVTGHGGGGEAHAADLHIPGQLRMAVVQVIGGIDADRVSLARCQPPEFHLIAAASSRQAASLYIGVQPRSRRIRAVPVVHAVAVRLAHGQNRLPVLILVCKIQGLSGLRVGEGQIDLIFFSSRLRDLPQGSSLAASRVRGQGAVGIRDLHRHADVRQRRQLIRVDHRLHGSGRNRLAGMGIAPVEALRSHLIMAVRPLLGRLRLISLAFRAVALRAYPVRRVLRFRLSPQHLSFPVEGIAVPVEELQPVTVPGVRRKDILGKQRLIVQPLRCFIFIQGTAGDIEHRQRIRNILLLIYLQLRPVHLAQHIAVGTAKFQFVGLDLVLIVPAGRTVLQRVAEAYEHGVHIFEGFCLYHKGLERLRFLDLGSILRIIIHICRHEDLLSRRQAVDGEISPFPQRPSQLQLRIRSGGIVGIVQIPGQHQHHPVKTAVSVPHAQGSFHGIDADIPVFTDDLRRGLRPHRRVHFSRHRHRTGPAAAAVRVAFYGFRRASA